MMDCHSYNELIHIYLDGDATPEQKAELYAHMDVCPECKAHVNELKKAIAFIQSSSHIEAPADFTTSVMNQIPKKKKRVPKVKRLFKKHPILVAAAVFFLMMSTAVFSTWTQNDSIVVSGNGPFVIDKVNGVVTVPEGAVIDGDLMVRNGTLQLDGEVRGDILLLNSSFDKDSLYASPNQVTGDIEEVDQFLHWIWFNTKDFFTDVFSFFNDNGSKESL
ncbi:anti-sigma factor [Shouchella lehensis]|uniref:Anti-sigma-W factor RsiW n=1 Tax=Shouchella lehensis TaxID=300825 RepID=A0A4Y7WMU1_9BACI|nr:anti-sigma factor [Shouchella lehensis]